MRSHGYKVMEAVNSYINSLDNTETSERLLYDLGNRHSTYASGCIKKEYFSVRKLTFYLCLEFTKIVPFQILTGAILEVIKRNLNDDFTPDVAHAWNNVINHLKWHIASGLSEN